MKAEVKIPVGYRRLRKNEILQKGDKFQLPDEPGWFKTLSIGSKPMWSGPWCIYIRKVRKVKK